MCVYLDRYIGYSFDIENDLNILATTDVKKYEELMDMLVWDNCDLSNSLKELGLKTHYGKSKAADEGEIEIVHDPLTGEYTKIMYILKVERFSGLECEIIDQTVNDFLQDIPTPADINAQIAEIYKEIFNKNMNGHAQLELLDHWH